MTLGERICARRTALGFSQDKLAEQLDVSRQSVSKWETDASVPDLDKLVKLSEVFGMTLDELVRGESGAQPEEEPPQETEVSPPTVTIVEHRGLRVSQVLGVALIACGFLAAILLMALGGYRLGLILGGLVIFLGVIFLLPPAGRLICLWAIWLLLVVVLVPAATGVRPGWAFSWTLYTQIFSYPYSYYLIMAWSEVLTGLALVLSTVHLIRKRWKKA